MTARPFQLAIRHLIELVCGKSEPCGFIGICLSVCLSEIYVSLCVSDRVRCWPVPCCRLQWPSFNPASLCTSARFCVSALCLCFRSCPLQARSLRKAPVAEFQPCVRVSGRVRCRPARCCRRWWLCFSPVSVFQVVSAAGPVAAAGGGSRVSAHRPGGGSPGPRL